MVFLLLIKGRRFRSTKTKTQVFVFVLRTRRPDASKKNCLLFNENFPAEKPSPLLESILATTYRRHKLFIDRASESFPVQSNAFFIIPSRKHPNYKSKGRLAFKFCLLIQNSMRLPEETLKNFTNKLGRKAKQSG